MGKNVKCNHCAGYREIKRNDYVTQPQAISISLGMWGSVCQYTFKVNMRTSAYLIVTLDIKPSRQNKTVKCVFFYVCVHSSL